METFQEILLGGLKNYGAQVIGTLLFVISARLYRRYKKKMISGAKLIISLIFWVIIGFVLGFAFRNFNTLEGIAALFSVVVFIVVIVWGAVMERRYQAIMLLTQMAGEIGKDSIFGK